MKANENFLICNSMLGTDYQHFVCSCGHTEKIPNNRLSIVECPNCCTRNITYHENIKFGKINFAQKRLFIKNIGKDLYHFAINLVDINGTYEINFSKKEIKNIKIENNKNTLIIFNAHDKDNMLCYYDNDGNQVSLKEFLSLYPDSLNSLSHDITSNTLSGHYIDLKYSKYYINKNLSTLRHLTFYLNNLKEYCSKNYREILIKAGIDPSHIPEHVINASGTDPCSILGIKKYTLKQILKYNQSQETFFTLKRLEDELGDKAVSFMDKFAIKDERWLNGGYSRRAIELINKADLSVDKLYKYLYNEAPLTQCLYDPFSSLILLSDSYDMTKVLNLPFDKKPKALKRYHDILVRESSIISDELKNEKIKEISKSYSHLEKISLPLADGTFKEDYSIMLPKDAQDIIREGKMMNHCVGSYVDRMIKGNCLILFLRIAKNPDKPYVTMEYNPMDQTIMQIKSFGNSRAHDNVIKFVKKWAKENSIKIASYY